MTVTTLEKGDVRQIGNHAASGYGAFVNLLGAATDPSSVLLTVIAPDGTQTEYAWQTPVSPQQQLLKESDGRFYAFITFDQAGIWRFRLAGVGTSTAAAEFALEVRRSILDVPS